MELQITELQPDANDHRGEWQRYADRAPTATLFHSLNWMDAVRSSYPHRPHYLMAWNQGDVVGLFPLFEVRSLLAGRLLVSVPYAVYGGVLCDDQDVADALLAEARRIAHRIGARYIDIRSSKARWPDLTSIDRYVTFMRDLPQSVDDVLGLFPRKARAEVRRARDKFQLSVRFDDAQIETVWRLYSQSMRRLGSPNSPRRFFRSLLDATPDQHLVSVIYDGRKPVAGLLSFIHGGTVYPYYSGCDHVPATRMGANNYLYMTLMEKAVELGVRKFDFGRTRVDNIGSYNFKKNQGFEPTPLGYQFDMPNGGRVPNLTPSNRKFHFAQQVWKKLPLAITRPLGSWLSASIPG
ncbi:MAG: FemAB family PEP-CTERM system-associated protein [Planctomycetes bacterium]|nr:FemAB family PEP-CTERM system-associated protein [Planctomycetota bacterium]